MTHRSKIKPASLATALLTLAGPSIAAAQSSAPLADLYACQVISDSRAQLSCFISETAKLQAAETSGDVIAVEKETFAEIKNAEVEAEVASQKAEIKQAAKAEARAEKVEPPKVRVLAVKEAKKFGPNRWVRFTLENGEIWQQTESKYVRVGKGNPDMLTIKRAAFGSFLAKVNDKGSSFRIKQVN